MTLDIQSQLKNNNYYRDYLRSHSYWYKALNRDPSSFELLKEEAKEFYKIRPVDKLSNAVDTLSLMGSILSSMKR